jgi:hypothetical protein
MYYIRYVDPITGASFDYQSASLEEIVQTVSRAKDELYFKGYVSAKTQEDAKEEPKEEATPPEEEPAQDEAKEPQHDYYEDYDEDNLYGVWY